MGYKKKLPKAYCSECFDGEVVEDNLLKGILFCNACYTIVSIRKFEGSGKG